VSSELENHGNRNKGQASVLLYIKRRRYEESLHSNMHDSNMHDLVA